MTGDFGKADMTLDEILSAAKSDPFGYLDGLEPEAFVRELTEILESLAHGPGTIELRVDRSKVQCLSGDLERGILAREPITEIERAFPRRLRRLVETRDLASVEITLPAREAAIMAADLARGIALREDREAT